MILVADSGSTKCDWILITEDRKVKTKTMGFNPFFHDQEFIKSKIEENEVLNQYKDEISELYFYGAGCSSPERNIILENALSQHFKRLSTLIVDEDLIGAAYATCGHEPGVVCILGTGSNSCYYDGQTVRRGSPALGYILGDEGSGAYFGKQLVSRYIYNQLPQDLATAFKEYNNFSLENILSSVYNKPFANVFLASFMKFIANNREHPYFQKMVYDGIKLFAEIHIMQHKEFETTNVNFVGSVAYYFEETLEQVAKDLNFKVGKIVQKPIEALSDYHQKQVKSPIH